MENERERKDASNPRLRDNKRGGSGIGSKGEKEADDVP